MNEAKNEEKGISNIKEQETTSTSPHRAFFKEEILDDLLINLPPIKELDMNMEKNLKKNKVDAILEESLKKKNRRKIKKMKKSEANDSVKTNNEILIY